MSETMTEGEFATWEVLQPLRFELADGRPVRQPDESQELSRLGLVRQMAMKVLGDDAAVHAWLQAPLTEFGGLEPEALAADGEDGCQLVLRALVRLGRLRDASHG